MTAIDRTAYPRLGVRLTTEELQARYDLSEADHVFLITNTRGDTGRLVLATLLKTRQDFGWFPPLGEVDPAIVARLAAQLDVASPPPSVEECGEKTLYRYRIAIRTYLSAAPYGEGGEKFVEDIVLKAAETMSDPADLINTAVEALYNARIELPAFSTLDRLVNHLRTQVHTRMYDQVLARLRPEVGQSLDALLVVPPGRNSTSPFNRLKQTPGPARLQAIRLWAERLEWLVGLVNPDPALEGIAHNPPVLIGLHVRIRYRLEKLIHACDEWIRTQKFAHLPLQGFVPGLWLAVVVCCCGGRRLGTDRPLRSVYVGLVQGATDGVRRGTYVTGGHLSKVPEHPIDRQGRLTLTPPERRSIGHRSPRDSGPGPRDN